MVIDGLLADSVVPRRCRRLLGRRFAYPDRSPGGLSTTNYELSGTA